MRKLSRLLAAVALIALLGGCGGGESSPDAMGADAPSMSSVDEIVCEGDPRPGVALDPQAMACADNGFEPQADVFGFANFGGTGTLDATGMVALFGPEAVCAEGAGESCTLLPAAKAWLEQVNQAMSAGRCEGMAVVAARLEEGGEPVSMLQSGAQATVDLLQENESVVGEIEYWWATQMVPEVAEPTSQVRAMQPSEVVATLIQGLNDGTGYTLGMYSEAGGHAVTPFAVSQSPDGTLDIAIYDNNDPTVISHVIVDPSTQTWTYDMGAINPGAEASAWTGTGPGTLDLTAMDWRTGPFSAPFADSGAESAQEDGQRTFLVTAGLEPGEGSVGAQITVAGVSVDTTRGMGEALSLPKGVVVTPIKASVRGGRTVVGVQVTAPSSVGEVSVSPLVKANPAAPSAQGNSRRILAQVSVDAPGQPRVTVTGPSSPQAGQFVLTSAGDGTTQVKASRGIRILASIATGRASVTIQVPRGGEVEVGDDAGGEAEVVITDETGEEYVVDVDGLTEGEIVELVASLTDGEWTLEPWTGDEEEPWADSEWLAEEDSSSMDDGDVPEDTSGTDEGSSSDPGDSSGTDEGSSSDPGDSSGADEGSSSDTGDSSSDPADSGSGGSEDSGSGESGDSGGGGEE